MATKRRKRLTRKGAAGHLLILACSATKRADAGTLPALERYDGGSYRVLRKFLRESGWPPGLIIKIISAKHGLLDATDQVEIYDQRLTEELARKRKPKVIKGLSKLGRFRSVFGVVPGRGKGSHTFLFRADPPTGITVPRAKDVKRGTLRAIIREAGLSVDEFLALL